MLRFNFFIPAALIDWFRAFAKRKDMTLSEAIRLALREFKDKTERRK